MGYKVVALDVNDATLEVCKKQGADAVFNSRTNKDYIEELKALTDGGAKAACVSKGSGVRFIKRTLTRFCLATFQVFSNADQVTADQTGVLISTSR